MLSLTGWPFNILSMVQIEKTPPMMSADKPLSGYWFNLGSHSINGYYCHSLLYVFRVWFRHVAAVKVLFWTTVLFICKICLTLKYFILTHMTHIWTHDLQEVHTASARWWCNPDKAETGRGLVADMRGDHTANKLGSSKLTLWHHTWRKEEKRSETPRRITERNKQENNKEKVIWWHLYVIKNVKSNVVLQLSIYFTALKSTYVDI